jgi:hypothetical protein
LGIVLSSKDSSTKRAAPGFAPPTLLLVRNGEEMAAFRLQAAER